LVGAKKEDVGFVEETRPQSHNRRSVECISETSCFAVTAQEKRQEANDLLVPNGCGRMHDKLSILELNNARLGCFPKVTFFVPPAYSYQVGFLDFLPIESEQSKR
jgi:hypothetical protein